MPDATDNDADLPADAAGADAAGGDDHVAGPVTAATTRLLTTAASLDGDALAGPTRCDGWSRAHVLSHVARNADAVTNLLTWASTGVETPMYASAQAREADIEDGATRDLVTLVDDVRATAARFSSAVSAMPDDGWEQQVRTGPGGAGSTIPARRVLWLRLREVEIHHVDLDAGYAPADWPAPFVTRALREALQACGRREDVAPFSVAADGAREAVGGAGELTVHGEAAELLGWLTGRTSGAELRVEPAGALPVIPAQAWL